jgi:hypothetical protein
MNMTLSPEALKVMSGDADYLRFLRDGVMAKGSPDEPRDEHGRWTSGGAEKLTDAIDKAHEELSSHLDAIAEASSKLDEGSDFKDMKEEKEYADEYGNEDAKTQAGRDLQDAIKETVGHAREARDHLQNLIGAAQKHLGVINRHLKDNGFEKVLAMLTKSEPAAADVHQPTTGQRRKKKPVSFLDAMTEAEDQIDKVPFGDFLPQHGHTIDKAEAERSLKPHEDGGAHSPFPHDPQALDRLHSDQVRRFLGAMTDQDDLEDRRVPVNSLVALQPRVDDEKVGAFKEAMDEGDGEIKPPLVVRWSGKNYVADGHHRAAASWLRGDRAIDAKYVSLSGDDDEIGKGDDGDWSMRVDFAKLDGEHQQIFGIASTTEVGGKLVIDKQDDAIDTGAMEQAVYEYVLDGRDHGEMHKIAGTGRLIESFMLTAEKRAAFKKHGYTLSLKNAKGQEVSGWLVGYQIDEPTTWAAIKRGDLPEFSIGGSGEREEL